jgi:hypothetical protein
MQNMKFPNAAKHALLTLTPTYFLVNETTGKHVDTLSSYVRLVAINSTFERVHPAPLLVSKAGQGFPHLPFSYTFADLPPSLE